MSNEYYLLIKGPPLGDKERIIAALVERLGGEVTLEKSELEAVGGLMIAGSTISSRVNIASPEPAAYVSAILPTEKSEL